jgi:murein L,D-transpeptidase YcbB/YkuD
MTLDSQRIFGAATGIALALAASATPVQAARAAGQPVITPAPVGTTQAPASPTPAAKPAPGSVDTWTVLPSSPTSSPSAAPPAVPPTVPPAIPVPPVPTVIQETIMPWSVADARALLAFIKGIGSEGLIPADYKPDVLAAAIAAGESPALNEAASKSFSWLAEDMRDGRTPMAARVQWFAVDKDVETNPTDALMTRALASRDIAGTLTALDPTYPDYAVLKNALASTPAAARKTRATIRANMDRWRWFSRDLGEFYLMTNVPEFQLRLVRRDKIVRTYRTIVGKPGKTATPQLAETVQGVIFNPTWTVPQSIVKGEGLGARLIGNAAEAKREGYLVTKSADGTITVVQQPGPGNSLGLVKLDMPNPHAIFLHDTPARQLFNAPFRALSHGCVRTERAKELAITLAIIGAEKTPEEAVAISDSGIYTKVPMTKTMPVYIGYFTMAKDITGTVATFADIYQRDAPVLASFNAPRELKTTQRTSAEKVVAIEAPGA